MTILRTVPLLLHIVHAFIGIIDALIYARMFKMKLNYVYENSQLELYQSIQSFEDRLFCSRHNIIQIHSIVLTFNLHVDDIQEYF
jgi:hypothetical protein